MGKLTKAPEFDKLPGFDKTNNGLWEIKTKVSDEGLVFVNLDARDDVEGWNSDLKVENRIKGLKLKDSKFIGEWKEEGSFNWKLTGTVIFALERRYYDWSKCGI